MTLAALGTPLTADDADIFEEHVAPRCRALFEGRLLSALVPGDDAAVVHLGCRTGYHDEAIAQRAGAASLVGVDASPEALAVARARSAARRGGFSYAGATGLPVHLPGESFSHVVSFYSLALQGEGWRSVVEEASRLLQPGGQLLMALPLRGAYPELLDLLRESGEAIGADLAEIIDEVAAGRPNIESLTDDLESSGFNDVDVTLHRLSLEYGSGPEFLDDAVARLLFEPHLRAMLPAEHGDGAATYLRSALERYWSELPFDLSINLGCVSALR